jgi:hypothetical protein
MKNKKKCSCYGGFDCSDCNPEYYENQKPDKSANDWLTELMESTGCGGKVDEVPSGWMTLQQMADQQGVVPTTMNGRVQRWIKNGLLQKKEYKIKNGRQISGVFHYYKVENALP